MQAWQIIVTSAVVASIAAVALFLPGAVRSPGGAASLFQTYWPGFIVVWLVIYSIAALALSTAESVRELGDPTSGRAGLDWPHRYLLRLGVTQYFSAVLILFAVGLLPGTIVTEPVFSVPAALGSSLAPAACAVAIIVGVLGWLTATIVAAFRAPAVWTASSASPDTQLLHDIVELLRARPAEPAPVEHGTPRRTSPARSGDRGGAQGAGGGGRPGAHRHFRNSARFSAARAGTGGPERFRGAGRCRGRCRRAAHRDLGTDNGRNKTRRYCRRAGGDFPYPPVRTGARQSASRVRARSCQPSCRSCCETWRPVPRRVRAAPVDPPLGECPCGDLPWWTWSLIGSGRSDLSRSGSTHSN